MTDGAIRTAVGQLLERNGSFAIYRLPGDDRLRYTESTRSVAVFGNVRALNGESGFVMAPFHPSAGCPITLIRGEEKVMPGEVSAVGDDEQADTDTSTTPVSPAYEERFGQFVASLRAGMFRKLVLSREMKCELPPAFSPAEAFLYACTRYPRSYVYLCRTPQAGVWLGATPEALLTGDGVWHTAALAGTQRLIGGQPPSAWDAKNREEQALVAGYIRSQLTTMGIRAEESALCTVCAGGLAHLRSDFTFALHDSDRLGDLLDRLHPTPAVCGLPKAEALRFILDTEGYDRHYYSGFIGRLDPQGRSDLYVNLRCMHIGGATLTFYAGGGLLPASRLEDEWKETEHKMQTMAAIAAPQKSI